MEEKNLETCSWKAVASGYFLKNESTRFCRLVVSWCFSSSKEPLEWCKNADILLWSSLASRSKAEGLESAEELVQ